MYNLDGLVIHDVESLKNGKWFSYVRNSHFESWTMYDGAERAVEGEATVLDDDPYLLFYSKVETPATSGLDSRSVPNAVGGPSRFCVPSKDSQRFVTSTDRVSKTSSTNGVSTSANSESTSKSANSGNNNEHNSIGDRKIRPINVDREQRNEPIIPVVDIDSDESSDGELQVLDSSDEKEIPNHLQQGENIGKKGERFIRKWTKRISMPEWARSLRIRRLRKPILKDKSKRRSKTRSQGLDLKQSAEMYGRPSCVFHLDWDEDMSVNEWATSDIPGKDDGQRHREDVNGLQGPRYVGTQCC